MIKSYIGLGSNLYNSKKNIFKAWEYLSIHPKIKIIAISNLYKSSPMGPKDQPNFINAVGLIKTNLHPYALLLLFKRIEKFFGRTKNRKWGERILDIDILLYGNIKKKSSKLILPHPGCFVRDFVAIPLGDINRDLVPANFFLKKSQKIIKL